MKITRRSLLAAGVGIAAAGPAPAQSRYTIGHENPLEPFAFLEAGQSKGYLVEIVEAALRAGEVNFAWKPLTLARMDPELEAGHIQAFGFAEVSPAAHRILDFSKTLLLSGAGLFTRADSNAPTEIAAYRDRIVAVPARGAVAEQIARLHPEVKLMRVETYDLALEAVLARRADAAVLNFPVGLRLARMHFRDRFDLPLRPFAEQPLAFAVAKGKHPELMQAFERGYNMIVIDGQKDAIVARWARELY